MQFKEQTKTHVFEVCKARQNHVQSEKKAEIESYIFTNTVPMEIAMKVRTGKQEGICGGKIKEYLFGCGNVSFSVRFFFYVLFWHIVVA